MTFCHGICHRKRKKIEYDITSYELKTNAFSQLSLDRNTELKFLYRKLS